MPEIIEEEYVENIGVFSRYLLYDDMMSNVEPPNRRFWSIDQLYYDWKEKGFFDVFRNYGFITVSYNNSQFVEFSPSKENKNRHEAVALSFFLSCHYDKVNICCPHEQDVIFSAIFETISDKDIIFKTIRGDVVQFHFNNNIPSQFTY